MDAQRRRFVLVGTTGGGASLMLDWIATIIDLVLGLFGR